MKTKSEQSKTENDTVIICLCSPERLNQYKVLYRSIKKYIGDEVDTLLYYGGEDEVEFPSTNISEWVARSPYKHAWYTYCYLRPRAIKDAFSKGYKQVILCGADTEFFARPSEVLGTEESPLEDMWVTMYTYHPYPDDRAEPTDFQIYDVGQIQADFVGFRNTPSTRKFLEWLDKRLSTDIEVNRHGRNKIMLDQAWMSMCFSYVENVRVIRHWGYNVGNYNMYPRGFDGVRTMANGDGLVLFHYAGFPEGREHIISTHQQRYTASGKQLDFLKDYTRKLNEP